MNLGDEMAFIAGVLPRDSPISESLLESFERALQVFERELAWPVDRIEGEGYLLVQAGPVDMWEGPKAIKNRDYVAIATGIQWRKIPAQGSASAYLSSCLLHGKEIGNYFDYYSVAVVNSTGERRCILATDALGMAPIAYCIRDGCLLFSSHVYFLRLCLESGFVPNLEAIFEYLLIRHLLGNKTFIEGVELLGPGSKLEFTSHNHRVARYVDIDDVGINYKMSLDEHCRLIWKHLNEKFENYCLLAKKDFGVLLSGGWDSRLIAAFLASHGRLSETFTTEEGVQKYGRLLSEGKIAAQVSKFLKAKNHYVKPREAGTEREFQSSLRKLLTMVDFSSTFHRWTFPLEERIPQGERILTDGILGATVLR